MANVKTKTKLLPSKVIFLVIIFSLFASLITPLATKNPAQATTVAKITDCKFGKAQIFDVQWNIAGGNLNISGITSPYRSNPSGQQIPSNTILDNDFFQFYENGANLGLKWYKDGGITEDIIHTSGTFRAYGDNFIFYLGGGGYGTVITTGSGFAYGSSTSLPITTENPSIATMLAYTSCGTTTLAAGVTRTLSPPSPPVNLATKSKSGEIELSWTAPAGVVTGYKVEMLSESSANGTTWTQDSDWTELSASTPDLTFSKTGLTNSLTADTKRYRYKFRVTSINNDGTSAAVETNFVTTVPGINGNSAIVGDPGCLTNMLDRNDDNSAVNVELGFNVNWYGETFDKVAFNNNGGIKFKPTSFWGQYSGLDLTEIDNDPLIVALFNDLDTRNTATTRTSYGPLMNKIEGREGYCFNWTNIGYFSSGAPAASGQLILLRKNADLTVNDGDVFLIFNYNSVTDRDVITGWAAPDGKGYVFNSPIPKSGDSEGRDTGSKPLRENQSPSDLVSVEMSAFQNMGRYIFEISGGGAANAPGSAAAPTGLSLSGRTAESVTLNWTAPTEDVSGIALVDDAITNYTFSYSTDGINFQSVPFASITRDSNTSTSVTISGLVEGQNYYFRVAAFTTVTGNESLNAGPFTTSSEPLTPPPAPPTPQSPAPTPTPTP